MSKFQEIINSDTPVLVDFYAEWCGPCKMMPPVLKQVKDEFTDKIRIIKIDVDKNQAIATHYNIRSIPSILLFKKGQQIWSGQGAMPANQLIPVIKGFI